MISRFALYQWSAGGGAASDGSAAGRPLVVYFHGGGFALGGLDMGNWMCGSVAANVGAVVVSVDYRLAPSHVFPAAVEDCYAALAWAAGNAAELGATGRIGVMGESAGGNLAAVTCLIARERGGPDISHQALIYPATDMTKAGPGVGGPVGAVPVRGGDKRLQAALPRPGRGPGQPVGVAAARRPRRRCPRP